MTYILVSITQLFILITKILSEGETMNNFNGINSMQQRNQFSSYFNPTSVASASTNNIVWVQGIEGAKAWQLNPNSMIILLDSEVEGKMYIKVSDNIGMSTLRIFNYVEELPSSSTNNVTINNDLDLSQYVKKDELNSLIKEIITNEQLVQSASVSNENEPIKSRVITVKK